jgi:hypothetical protein
LDDRQDAISQSNSSMPINIGTAIAKGESAFQTGQKVAKDALKKLGQDKCDQVIVFSSVKYNLKELIKGIRSVTGDAQLIGCSSSGEITNQGMHTGSVVVMCIKTDAKIHTGYCGGIRENSYKAGKDLSNNILKDLPAPVRGTMLINPEGLGVTMSSFVQSVFDTAGAGITLVGGSAGDELKFESTYQFWNDAVLTNSVTGIFFPPEISIGIGIQHGWSAAGDLMVVTKSEGNIIYELDNQPALDVFLKGINASTDNVTQEYLTEVSESYSIGISDISGNYEVRHIYAPTPNKGIVCFGEIPQESIACIMKGSTETLIEAAEQAAREALSKHKNKKVQAAIVFDCAARAMVLKENTNKEIQSIQKVLGQDVPIFGFYTYGEICAFEGGQPKFQNRTIIVCTIME